MPRLRGRGCVGSCAAFGSVMRLVAGMWPRRQHHRYAARPAQRRERRRGSANIPRHFWPGPGPMRLSRYPINTLRDVPADAEVVSHQLMLRAGLIRRLASGLYTWLPMGLRVLRKVEAIVREEMDRAGAIELADADGAAGGALAGIGALGPVRARAAAPRGPPRPVVLSRTRRTRKSSPTSHAASSRATASSR